MPVSRRVAPSRRACKTPSRRWTTLPGSSTQPKSNSDEEALRRRARHPDRHRRFRRHRRHGHQRARRFSLRAVAGLGCRHRRDRHLRLCGDVGPGRGDQRPADVRPGPGAAGTPGGLREPGRLHGGDPVDVHRRDRRRRARSGAGEQRQLPAVDTPGRVRGVVGPVAREVLSDGERLRAVGAQPDRVRGGGMAAGAGLVDPVERREPTVGASFRGRSDLLLLRGCAVRSGDDALRGVLLLLRGRRGAMGGRGISRS
jgi:hypothetical protein